MAEDHQSDTPSTFTAPTKSLPCSGWAGLGARTTLTLDKGSRTSVWPTPPHATRFRQCQPPRRRVLTSPRKARPSQTQPNPNTFPVGATRTQTRVVPGRNTNPSTGIHAAEKAACHREASTSHQKMIAPLVLTQSRITNRHPMPNQPANSKKATRFRRLRCRVRGR